MWFLFSDSALRSGPSHLRILFPSHRNVMMRLNLQLTMGTFSLSLFGLMGVAFGMNLESSLEEVRRYHFSNLGILFYCVEGQLLIFQD